MQKSNHHQYFADCKTLKEARQIRDGLVKKFHPDKPGGSTETCAQINSQFDQFKKDLAKGNTFKEKFTPPDNIIQLAMDLFQTAKGYVSIHQHQGVCSLRFNTFIPLEWITPIFKGNNFIGKQVENIQTTNTDHVITFKKEISGRLNWFLTGVRMFTVQPKQKKQPR